MWLTFSFPDSWAFTICGPRSDMFLTFLSTTGSKGEMGVMGTPGQPGSPGPAGTPGLPGEKGRRASSLQTRPCRSAGCACLAEMNKTGMTEFLSTRNCGLFQSHEGASLECPRTTSLEPTLWASPAFHFFFSEIDQKKFHFFKEKQKLTVKCKTRQKGKLTSGCGSFLLYNLSIMGGPGSDGIRKRERGYFRRREKGFIQTACVGVTTR